MLFTCERCGACCKPGFDVWDTEDIYIHITESEQRRIADLLVLSVRDLCLKFNISDNKISLRRSACSFLNAENECSIQSVKPLCCKRWPDIGFNEDKQNLKKSAKFCRGIKLKEA